MTPSPSPSDVERTGVLLVNLGTPDSAEPKAVRRYLKEFLSDPRVVEIPAIVWQPILRGIILNRRPKHSAKAYAKVWTDKGSPLAVITAKQAEKLQARLGDQAIVRHAMRYGAPAIADELAQMLAAGCTRILVAALYPQYCAATTASAHDALFAALRAMRWQPAIRTLPPYYDVPLYIDALRDSVQAYRAGLADPIDHLLISFHGVPKRTLDLGDPYGHQCQKTAALLSEQLDIPTSIGFQSRFGRAEWLGPATDAEITRLAGAGVRHLGMIAPGFSADCLETLEELAIVGKASFLAAGGERFSYIPCLNATEPSMDMIEELIRNELSGWLTD